MTVNVGVIGLGMIGEAHVRRVAELVAGSEVVAVSDVDAARAAAVAERVPAARVLPTGAEVIADPAVDAVVVASSEPTHEEFVLACLEAGKPVFCEKPLATSGAAASRIVDAEAAAGRRLVQVGFMRRYDFGYRALKQTMDSGAIGAPLLMHCAHRNPAVPPSVTTEMALHDSVVHEVDLVRWLFEEEVASAQVLAGRRNRTAAGELQDPLVVVLEMASGVLVDVELSLNVSYGYDIRGEVVGESGAVALSETPGVALRSSGRWSGRIPNDWRERFEVAYDSEIAEWVSSVEAGGCAGPSAWDGYAATVVVDCAVSAFRSGQRRDVSLRERPELYAKDG